MTQDIELALQQGRLKGAKQLLKEYYENKDKAEYEEQLRSEYDSLYPKYKIIDYDIGETAYNELRNSFFNELDTYDVWLSKDFNIAYAGCEPSYLKIEINYKQTPPTFNDWLNETRVVTEASYVCDECQLALDSETCTNNAEHITRLIPEVTELVRPYIPKDTSERVDNYIKSKYAELRRKEYPQIEEFADAWVKNDTDGMELYRSKCLAVKEKYPKG